MLMVLFTGMVNAQCDFSKVKLQQWNQGTYYKWQLTGWDIDSCKNYMFMVYDFQNKKTDTVADIKGIVEVNFNRPGEYKLYVKLWDKCKKCDTTMYRPVKIIAWKPTAKVTSFKKTCDSMWFEMPSIGSSKDTCWTNYYYVYGGKELDDLTDKEWATMSDADLYWYYSFDEKDLLTNPESRILKYKFPKKGKYLVIGQYYNKCLNQDTAIFTRHTINCNTTSVTVFNKPESKLIGMYDMMGRRVYNVKEDELVIYLYNDGSTKKVIKR